VGGKRDADSYVQIAAQIGRPAEDILFLSDIVEELDAARAAGMATTRLVRDAQPASDASHLEVASFAAINP
jgi:enolase-phosphatase E1